MNKQLDMSFDPKRRNPMNTRLPDQRLRTSEKMKIDRDFDENYPRFIRETIDALDNNDNIFRNTLTDYDEIEKNYKLISGNPDFEEIEEVCNNFGLAYDRTHQYYDILKPRITVLANEALTMRKEYRATLLNSDALNAKEEDMKLKTHKLLQELIASKGLTQEEAQRRLEAHQDYLTYDYRDIREEYAQHIMNFYAEELDLHDTMSESVIDILCSNRIIYALDIEYNSLVLRKPDVLNVEVWMPIGQYDLSKALAIREIQYMTEVELNVHFGDILTDEDRKIIRDCFDGVVYNSFGAQWSTSSTFYVGNKKVTDQSVNDVNVSQRYNRRDKRNYIENDTIRVAYHTWLSERLVLEVHKIDQATGNEIITIEDEDYILDDVNGEWAEEKWIPEYWGAIEIGEFCIIKYGPKPQQYRKQDNLGDVKSGYFGVSGLINDKYSLPIISSIRKEAYEYSFYRQKFQDAVKRDKGRLPVINKNQIPSEYIGKEDEYVYTALAAGFALKDENTFDASSIGNQKRLSDEQIDFSQDADIQKAVTAMSYVESTIDKYIGMSPQRLAQINGGDGKGTTDQAINTSLVISKNIFVTIDKVKRDILTGIVELSKVVLKNNNKTIQRITSDMGQHALKIDADLMMDCDIGIVTTNSTNDIENERNVKEIVGRALATKSITLGQSLELLRNNSYDSIIRKIQIAERKQSESEAKANEANQKNQERGIVLEETKVKNEYDYKMKSLELEAKKLELQGKIADDKNQVSKDIANEKNRTDIETAGVKATGFQNDADVNKNTIPDVKESIEEARFRFDKSIEQQRFELEKEKLMFEKRQSDNQDAIDQANILMNLKKDRK